MANEPNCNLELYKRLATSEAEHLAELYLIKGDLNAAYDTLDLYFAEFAVTAVSKEGSAALIAASLFRDGILLFCSCFSTKDNRKLDPATVYGELEDGSVEYARKLLDLRDAFVAHNFGPQRQHQIVIICKEMNGTLQRVGFTQHFVRFAGWVIDERDKLLPFIDEARKHMDIRIATAELAVMEQVMSITDEALVALPEPEVVIPDAEDYRISRSRFLKSGRGSRSPIPQRRLGPATVRGS